LLGNVDTGDSYQKKLWNLAFIEAKKCIAINWMVGYPPRMSQWVAEMSSYASLDVIYYKTKGILCIFHKVWVPYMEYLMTKRVCIENTRFVFVEQFFFFIGTLV
jgi:hypothetical protein